MPSYGHMVSSGMHHRNERENRFNNRSGNRGPGRTGGAAMDDPYSYRTGSNQMDHAQDHRPRSDRYGDRAGGRAGGGMSSDQRYRFSFSDHSSK